jgi:hypothetical protein
MLISLSWGTLGGEREIHEVSVYSVLAGYTCLPAEVVDNP